MENEFVSYSLAYTCKLFFGLFLDVAVEDECDDLTIKGKRTANNVSRPNITNCKNLVLHENGTYDKIYVRKKTIY